PEKSEETDNPRRAYDPRSDVRSPGIPVRIVNVKPLPDTPHPVQVIDDLPEIIDSSKNDQTIQQEFKVLFEGVTIHQYTDREQVPDSLFNCGFQAERNKDPIDKKRKETQYRQKKSAVVLQFQDGVAKHIEHSHHFQ